MNNICMCLQLANNEWHLAMFCFTFLHEKNGWGAFGLFSFAAAHFDYFHIFLCCGTFWLFPYPVLGSCLRVQVHKVASQLVPWEAYPPTVNSVTDSTSISSASTQFMGIGSLSLSRMRFRRKNGSQKSEVKKKVKADNQTFEPVDLASLHPVSKL